MAQTTFTLAYFLSLFITLTTIYLIHIHAPNMVNIVQFFVLPMTIAFITLLLFNNLFPTMNKVGQSIGDYAEYRVMDQLENTKYFALFPPLIIVFITFLIMVYLGVFN